MNECQGGLFGKFVGIKKTPKMVINVEKFWDETHFGKMASWYINRTFFFDVHPPLGKMLIALSGYLSGYNGRFPFDKPGDKYNGTRYEGMRYFCTTMGALIVPLVFDTVHDFTQSIGAAVVAAAYIMFDVGMLTLNQYILLDPILLFFMVASVWGMVKVSINTSKGYSYTTKWWFFLFFTGTMLACTISVKFVGLFVVLLVGFHTAFEIWTILGDLQKPIMETLNQLLCRSLALIIWPICLYLMFFYIHLHILNHSGNGDGFYSSAFQSSLIGNSLHNASMPRYVAYGSIVSIKNHKTGGGYLHSHLHLYPKGSGPRQQQVTSYTHKDENNAWLVKPYDKEHLEKLSLVKNGDLIRLEHILTHRNLHSHNEPAPISKSHMQVTGYGENGIGDANDIWKVVIIGGNANDVVQTVTTKFMLVHYLQGCALGSSGKQLPKWGFEQQEITCNANIRDPNTKWNVEDNKNNNLTSENFSVYAPGFFARFIESHAVMLQGNSGLKPKEGETTSRPWQWPINLKGQFFSGNDYRIYLLGNPIVWWSNLIFLNFFVLLFVIRHIMLTRQKAKLNIMPPKITHGIHNIEHYETISSTESLLTNDKSTIGSHMEAAFWLYIGWAIHYLPFWAMGRVLYFHHYFPALVFNSMLSGVMFHHITGYLPRAQRYFVLVILLAVLVFSFKLFSPLAYGMEGPSSKSINSTMYGLKWLPTWEF
ncbi:protein O-mannosyl-transferase 2 isoform X3 [Stomoxys calcitrans]|uniref:protein O-mannosyl-transferase 2 isoform X3 n=1 Tax=Stomoxys calcitrans TaxID=35570 RepID=UPI0027E32CEE|nr:protein O-mannosyl-transferase 2 isoform X3 [Stomoxys calcitrans]